MNEIRTVRMSDGSVWNIVDSNWKPRMEMPGFVMAEVLDKNGSCIGYVYMPFYRWKHIRHHQGIVESEVRLGSIYKRG